MYKIYKTSRSQITQLDKPTSDCWIDINNPSGEDLEELKPYLHIPEDIVASVQDMDEVPKVEEEDGFHFILIQTPYVKGEKENHEFGVMPLAILYNRNHVFTLHAEKNEVIDYLKTRLKNFHNNRIINTQKKQQLILKLMLFSAKLYLYYLKNINQQIFTVQKELKQVSSNKEIIHLLEIRKSLAYFKSALLANQIVAEKLAKRKFFKSTEADEELAEDVLDEIKQGIETVKVYEKIVVDTANAFATIISNNVNRTVKFLTSITIILMLPTLMASIYGMNIPLPYQNSPYAFPLVMGVLIFSVILGVVLFYRKKLF